MSMTALPANIFAADPAAVIEDDSAYKALLDLIAEETDPFVPDVSTKDGRDKIKSLAFKVTRTKTAIDAARKDLTEEARKRVTSINAAGTKIVSELDEIAKRIRKPLTEWEEAEKARAEQVESTLARLRNIHPPDGLEAIQTALDEIAALSFPEETFAERRDEAEGCKQWALGILREAHAKAEQAEKDRIELERLRAEAVERERIETERQAREERAKAEAEEKARIEAETKRREEERRRADEAIAEANRKAAQAEAAAQAERDRVAAEANRAAEEQAARERDKAHRSTVMREAKEGLMSAGLEEAAAKHVVKAIINGGVPHVTLRF